MLKHLVPMMKKMARPLLARRGAAQYPEHDLALAATFLWVIERHSGILSPFVCGGHAVGRWRGDPSREKSDHKILFNGQTLGPDRDRLRLIGAPAAVAVSLIISAPTLKFSTMGAALLPLLRHWLGLLNSLERGFSGLVSATRRDLCLEIDTNNMRRPGR